ncbi:hypothetical protein KP509_24G074900 [Ceratopteris richardii]|uniref:RRM domain-containing protein n=1 Tax=Ceratopteris richardii TaxID=49495 RepID=A0A8T2RYQ1_CERRI|nr:hypothetical protein KP509_24G074900 [Ceratopteris richardii]
MWGVSYSSPVSRASTSGNSTPRTLNERHLPGRSRSILYSSSFGANACNDGILQLKNFDSLRSSSCLFVSKASCYQFLVHGKGFPERHRDIRIQRDTRFAPFSPTGFICSSLREYSQKPVTCAWAHSEQHLSLQEDQQRILRVQQQKEALRKHQESILDSIARRQASVRQSALLSTSSKTECLSGYIPPGFDADSCRTVFVCNVHRKVTEKFLSDVFSTVGSVAACKLIRKHQLSHGFVEYQDHRAAAMAISTLNGRKLFRLPIKVNWAFPNEEREDLTDCHKIFVGGLSSDVTDTELFKLFSTYQSCVDACIMWDPLNARSKGFGFVTFKEREDAIKAIMEMNGKMVCDKAIKCAWAINKASAAEDLSGQGDKTIELPNVEDDPQYTSIFVGNLARQVSKDDLHEFFIRLGVGEVEDAYLGKGRDYGFVRYATHEAAARAIQAANGKVIGRRRMKCSWGIKPTLRADVSDSPTRL